MRIDIISAVPKLLESPFNDSILKRAQERKLVEIKIHNLRDYSTNKQKSIDDYAFGGGAGMVLSIEPIFNCIQVMYSYFVAIKFVFKIECFRINLKSFMNPNMSWIRCCYAVPKPFMSCFMNY